MGEPSGASVKVFWGAFFSKKVRPCPYRRAAHEKKLGKQPGNLWLPAPFPDGGVPGRWLPKSWAASQRCALSALLWRAPPPKGEARLGSPFGRAGAVRRLRGRGATVREKRFAVSLAFFPALRAYKVKAVGLCPTTRNPLKRVDLNFHLASLGLP